MVYKDIADIYSDGLPVTVWIVPNDKTCFVVAYTRHLAYLNCKCQASLLLLLGLQWDHVIISGCRCLFGWYKLFLCLQFKLAWPAAVATFSKHTNRPFFFFFKQSKYHFVPSSALKHFCLRRRLNQFSILLLINREENKSCSTLVWQSVVRERFFGGWINVLKNQHD